jgi:hypothetical protein
MLSSLWEQQTHASNRSMCTMCPTLLGEVDTSRAHEVEEGEAGRGEGPTYSCGKIESRELYWLEHVKRAGCFTSEYMTVHF